MKFKIILINLIILSSCSSLLAEGNIHLAVLELKANDISESQARTVTDLIRSDIIDSGLFTVVERSRMEAIFAEQSLQMTGCTDTSCAVKMGRLLSANKILAGEISKLGEAAVISISIVDVESGIAEFSVSESANSMDTINNAISALVGKLVDTIGGKRVTDFGGILAAPKNVTATDGVYSDRIVVKWDPVENAGIYYVLRAEDDGVYKLLNKTETTEFTDISAETGKEYYYKVKSGVMTRTGNDSDSVFGMSGKSQTIYYMKGIVPGWGQCYYGNNLKGKFFLGSFIMLIGFTGYSCYYYNNKKDKYNNVPALSLQSEFDSKYNDYKIAYNMLIGSAALSSIIYIYNWIDILWFNKPVYDAEKENKPAQGNLEFKFYTDASTVNENNTSMLLSYKIEF